MSHSIPRKLGMAAAAIFALWFSLRFLLPVFLPFLFAALLALCAEPLVGVLDIKLFLIFLSYRGPLVY